MNPENYLIPPADDGPARGKNLSALRRSRGGRGEMITLFGGADMLPSSVMRIRRTLPDPNRDGHAADRTYATMRPEYNRDALADPDTPRSIKDMHRCNGGSLTGTLSKFPQDVGRTVLLFYSEPGQMVVDPFMGHNSRMELCVENDRDYTGCDLSAPFMDFNRTRADDLRRLYPARRIKLHHTDSREQPVASGVGDVTITSPPYWDLEFYGEEPEQMGNCRTYPEFLDSMRSVLAENYRTLKPGAYSAWFVNDFRKRGVMYFYHADILRLGHEVGFIRHDIWIVDLGPCLRDIFTNEAVRTKVVPKRHEYVIVFRKPLE